MTLGHRILFFLILIFSFILSLSFLSKADDKILSSPLINIENIKPSFEESEEGEGAISEKKGIKEKITDKIQSSSHAVLIGLDKITAKSSRLKINLDEVKRFGPLEIKILKCGKVKINNIVDDVAYMQVKDLTKNEDEKVFIFNGWAFSSDPNLTPFDHAIYDLQLLNCSKV